MDRETILQQALSLSIEDRFFLLQQIDASLPLESGSINGMTDEELTAEIDRRIDAVERGEMKTYDAFEVLAELRAKYCNIKAAP